MSGGRKPRDKGVRFEREVVAILRERGIHAKRVPLSGSTEFQKGDIVIETLEGEPLVVETKKRKSEFSKLYEVLHYAGDFGADAVELLFIDPKENRPFFGPIIFLTLEKWLEIMTNFGHEVFLGTVSYDVAEGWVTLGRKLKTYLQNVDLIVVRDDRKPILVGFLLESMYQLVSRTLVVDGLTDELEDDMEVEEDEPFPDDEDEES